MRRSARIVIAGVMVASMVAALSPAASAKKASKVLGSGSDTTYLMMTALSDLYDESPGCEAVATPPTVQPLDFSCNPDVASTVHGENYAHDQVTSAFPLGSSNGIAQMCLQGNINYARSSRGPKGPSAGGTDCKGLKFDAYAKDGLTWECWATTSDGTTSGCNSMTTDGGGYRNLTQPDLNNIYVNCTFTNWNQVGGASVPIDPYTAQPGSGTRSSWEGDVGGLSTSCIPTVFQGQPDAAGSHIAEEHHNALIDTTNPNASEDWCDGVAGGAPVSCADQGNAIYYISAGRWANQYGPTSGNADGSAIGAVNGVDPTSANILSGSFPFSRQMYNVWCNGLRTVVKKIVHGKVVKKIEYKCGKSLRSTKATIGFVGPGVPQAGEPATNPRGWICKGEQYHSKDGTALTQVDVDPLTGEQYRTTTAVGSQGDGEIEHAIVAAGFVPLAKQADGSYCIESAPS
jgi:ABC-type phosphate transport system substrate-binding protein